MRARTSYRGIFLLAGCQALLLTETMNAAALPIIALIASAALWLAWQRRQRMAGAAAD